MQISSDRKDNLPMFTILWPHITLTIFSYLTLQSYSSILFSTEQ